MKKSEAIYNIIKTISPYRRMINSEGMDRAFDYVSSLLPRLEIHEFKPGAKADDWEVPYGWELKSAYMKNRRGEVIASNQDSHLFVAAYSEPVHGFFQKSEIKKHLRYHQELEHAFFMEHRNAYDYSLTDWGITLPKKVWDTMSDDEEYEIFIDVRKDTNRTMKVGELNMPGQSDATISFTAHIDELCNDNLSSCATLIQLFKDLEEQKTFRPYYTYQLLLVPETIGTYFYVHKCREKIRNTLSMINLETVGKGEKWIIKKSLNPVKYIDKIMKLSADEVLKNYEITDFFDGYGNEERIYEYPTINIPSVAIQRYPFKEYHSSEDIPENIDQSNLEKAYLFSKRVITMIENDSIPESAHLLPPWLTKHGLYFDSVEDAKNFNIFMNQIQFNLFKGHSIVDLAYKFNVPFEKLHEYLSKFYKKKLMLKKLTHEIWKN